MSIQFVPIALTDVREEIKHHLRSLPAAIDSYLEDHICSSAHYQVCVSGEVAGYISVHQGRLITQFSLKPSHKHLAQSVYSQARKLGEVESALVPTCDEFFLSHALDDHRRLTVHACFFAVRPAQADEKPWDEEPSRCVLHPAQEEDMAEIERETGSFFGCVASYVRKQELFLTRIDKDCVGFGIMVKSALAGEEASIGMFIIERFRRQGVGTMTLRLLMAECRRQGLRPIAGCGYENILSKKTLERAGMFSQTRLLTIDY